MINMTAIMDQDAEASPKNGLVRFSNIRLSDIRPSPENDRLYRPVTTDDPEIGELAVSIQRDGVLEPLVITKDRYILSGHRRYTASRLAGLTEVPCRVEDIRRTDDIDRFVMLLREFNRQRDKSNDEKLREEILTVDPHEAYASLIAHRDQRARVDVETMSLKPRKRRARITDAKRPMLEAVKVVVEALRQYWPVSERKIHYKLLNNPPLRHASKPGLYENTKQCSKDLSNLITRARLIGEIPFEAISDETRPRTTWNVHTDPRSFLRNEMQDFLKGYFRDLQRTQPNYLHIFAEKNTVYTILRPVAGEFCIPITSGRGFSSHEPIYEIAQAFAQSGKEQLILLVASDFDPSGECIAESFCRNLRDDYGVHDIVPVKFALTHDQVRNLDLPPSVEAKEDDARYKEFVEKHGTNAYELEALDEDVLQDMLRTAIDSVIDIDAFNEELEAERRDAAFLEGVRRQVSQSLSQITKGGLA